MYLGLDCSTLAIHGILLDEKEKIVSFYKWGSKKKSFEERFSEILLDFFEDLQSNEGDGKEESVKVINGKEYHPLKEQYDKLFKNKTVI